MPLAAKPIRSRPGSYVYRGFRVRRIPGPGSERHRKWEIVGKSHVWGVHGTLGEACSVIDMALPGFVEKAVG